MLYNTHSFRVVPKIHGREKWGKKEFLRTRLKNWLPDFIDNHNWLAVSLAVAGLGGLLLTAVVAPNVLGVFDKNLHKRKVFLKKLNRVRQYLREKGYIVVEKKSGLTPHYALTEKGNKKLAEFCIASLARRGKDNLFWDRRWRVIIYDVPEKYRSKRDKIRNLIKHFGCFPLLINVWVYPYKEAQDLVELLHFSFGRGKEKIYFFITNQIFGDDRELKEYFDL